ncbi:MAG: TolC family protein, partial [Spirochaetes bacterium]|nr:TolC family protein [Spirochaetota bacterium]
MKKSKIYILSLLLFISSSLPANSREKILTLHGFITLACEKDKVFEEILKDEMTLQYQENLALPQHDLILSVKGQYDFALGEAGESGPQATVGLSKLFPSIGTTVSAEYNSTFYSIVDSSRSELNLSLSQPIARNAFGRANRLLSQITGLEVAIASHQIVEAYEDYLAGLIRTYYSWYSAYANWQTASSSYQKNVKLLDNIKARKRSKIALQTDVNKINLQVLEKKGNLVSLSNDYQSILNMVKQAIAHQDREILVPDQPIPYKKQDISFEKDYDNFVLNSRTYNMLRLLDKKSELDVDRYADDLLPSANLLLGYTIEGADFSLKTEESKAYLGISLQYPLPGHKEKANYEISKIEQQKTALSATNKDRQLLTDLRNLYQEIEKERKLIELADKKIELAEDIAIDERKNYSYG